MQIQLRIWPFTPVGIFYGDLPSQIIHINNFGNLSMAHQFLPTVHPDSNQQPHKMHQWPHGVHPSLLHNTRIRSHIIHSREIRSPISQPKSTSRDHKQHYFLPLTTALKWPARKEHPLHSLRKIWPVIWQYYFSFYPWIPFPIIS